MMCTHISEMQGVRIVRILVSSKAQESVRTTQNSWFRNPTYVWVSVEEALKGALFDAAFISRDVTGKSTKSVTLKDTQNFYDLLKTSKTLKWVHIHSAGADRPIYIELMSKGVLLSTSFGANAKIVAQTALAGVLSLGRHFPTLQRSQTKHLWTPLVSSQLPTPDLEGQRVLIVGRGPVGLEITRLLRCIGMVCEHIRFKREEDLTLTGDSEVKIKSYHYTEIASVLSTIQYLILACPLSKESRGLIDKAMLDLLPIGAKLVNVARGEVVVEADLVEALNQNKLGGAYLDVFEKEPLQGGSPLWDLPNVIITPHSAGHSDGNEARVLSLFLANLDCFAKGELPNFLATHP